MGYKIDQQGTWYSAAPSTPPQYFVIYSWFLTEPWATASSGLDLSDSARLGIVALYPNPSQALTELHFNYTENYVPTDLVVYDEAGNIVQRRSIADPDSGKQ